ncbi:MAG: methyltransferase domain-containing protein [Cytophagales bacterium]
MEELKNKIATEEYWTKRYQADNTGWDIGYVSTPLKAYFDQLKDKKTKILIPGCGNAYEAKYLYMNGFKNVFLLDISEYPLQKFKDKNPDFPEEHLIHADFFDHSNSYDLIIEQTFFCALNPELREGYCKKMQNLMHSDSKLAGVLFNIPLFQDHPPFGGHIDEYKTLFDKYFRINMLEECRNSIPERMGSELFMELKK